MIIPDLKAFETYIDDLPRTMRWLQRQTGAPQAVIDLVLYDTAREMAQGRTFSTEKCTCGCGTEGRNTDIEHYMRKKAIRLTDEYNTELLQKVESSITSRLVGYMEAENEKFIAENMAKPTVWDWLDENSKWILPVLVIIALIVYIGMTR